MKFVEMACRAADNDRIIIDGWHVKEIFDVAFYMREYGAAEKQV